jgi:hypothetical protein
MTRHCKLRSPVGRGLTPRRVLLRCMLALMLAMPAAAYPLSLSQLLHLPLEQLLRLEISAQAATQRVQQ